MPRTRRVQVLRRVRALVVMWWAPFAWRGCRLRCAPGGRPGWWCHGDVASERVVAGDEPCRHSPRAALSCAGVRSRSSRARRSRRAPSPGTGVVGGLRVVLQGELDGLCDRRSVAETEQGQREVDACGGAGGGQDLPAGRPAVAVGDACLGQAWARPSGWRPWPVQGAGGGQVTGPGADAESPGRRGVDAPEPPDEGGVRGRTRSRSPVRPPRRRWRPRQDVARSAGTAGVVGDRPARAHETRLRCRGRRPGPGRSRPRQGR